MENELLKQQAEADYRAAVREYHNQPTRRNEDRVNIKRALYEGIQRWIAERKYGVA